MNIGDTARQRIEDDELDRRFFAEKLARVIALTPFSPEARVVALFGEWGCGKTTLKHFTAHYLRSIHKIEPVDFSPWEWTGRDRLLDAFFVQLGTALRKSKWPWQDLPLSYHFRRYAITLGVFAPLVSWGRSWWLPLLLSLSGTTSFLSSNLWIEGPKGLWFFSMVVGLTGVGLVLLQVATEGVSGYVAKLRELRRDSLDRVRADLATALCKHGRPVVVFIDDLDRLEPTEIRQMIALVKATANLPRITFVIFCQRHTVAHALDEIAGGPGCGDPFLEKIVQTSLHVPEPPTGRISAMLDKGLKRILEEPAFAERWEAERWSVFRDEHLSSFFRTPRHVARYLESLPLYLSQHVYDGKMEANPVDVAALEILRMFEPAVFEHLADESVIVEVNLFSSFPSDSEGRLDRLIEGIVSFASKARQPAVRSLLLELLPQLNKGRAFSEETRESWDRTKQLCHGNHYAKYFQLLLPANHISSADFERLARSAAQSSEALSAEFARSEQRGLLREVLNRSHVFLHGLASEARKNVYLSICRLGDRLPEKRGYGEDDWLKASAHGLAADLLRSASPEQRAQWIAEALSSLTGLDFPVLVVSSLNRETASGIVDLAVDPPQEASLKKDAVNRLLRAAEDGSLWRSTWLSWHLGFWAKSEGPEAVRKWLSSAVTSKDRALQLVMSLVAVSTSADSYFPRLHADKLDSYIDLERLAQLLPDVPEQPRERDSVILLRKALELKHSGKPLGDVKLNDRDP